MHNIGKHSGPLNAVGKANDHMVQLIDNNNRHEIRLFELDQAYKKQAAATEALAVRVAARVSETMPLYTNVADLRTDVDSIKDSVAGIQIPDIYPILDRISDHETRLRFNEAATKAANTEQLTKDVSNLRAALEDQRKLQYQADQFRAKTLADYEKRITRLKHICMGLALGLVVLYVRSYI